MVSRGSTSTLNEDEASWMDMLPRKSLFQYLREQGCSPENSVDPDGMEDSTGLQNIMCTIRGNLFVWNQRGNALLTLNLIRLNADLYEDIYQTLIWTLPESHQVTRLLPDENGKYIALCSKRGLTVMELYYYRGKYGEFHGGKEEALCKTISVASDLFAYITLVQVSWHLSNPEVLVLLTSDSFIRLFSLANPNVSMLEISLLPPSSGLQLRPHGLMLQGTHVAFSLWRNSAFVLHDNGDVCVVSLTQQPPTLSRPLIVNPPSYENYWSNPSSMLLLNTTPLVLIVVDSKVGIVYHCVYLESSNVDNQEEEEEDGAYDSGINSRGQLYVLERIQFQSGAMETDSQLTLYHNPANIASYFAVHAEGVHAVHLAWLSSLRTLLLTDSSSTSVLSHSAESQVTYLIGTEPNFTSLRGIAVVSESLLGHALIGLTCTDLECLTLALEEPDVGVDYEDGDDRRWIPQPFESPPRPSGLVKKIGDIFSQSRADMSPEIRRYKSRRTEGSAESQADLYKFLTSTVGVFRRKYILTQQQALKEFERKIEISQRLKECLITETEKLKEERDIMEEETERLQHKLEGLVTKNKSLQKQAERLACLVKFQSGVLSEAEECMMKEMEGIKDHLSQMSAVLSNDRKKLALYKEMDSSPVLDLNASQSTSLLKKLTDNGKTIKKRAVEVKELQKVLCI